MPRKREMMLNLSPARMWNSWVGAFQARTLDAAPKISVVQPQRALSSPSPQWGESWREGNLNKTRLLSPALSSFLRQEERGKCSAIGHFSTCVDTNTPGERVGVRGNGPYKRNHHAVQMEARVKSNLLAFVVLALSLLPAMGGVQGGAGSRPGREGRQVLQFVGLRGRQPRRRTSWASC